MRLAKFAVAFGTLICLITSTATASPSLSGLGQDSMNGVKDAFRQFAIGYQDLGAEIVFLEAERGPSAPVLGLGSAQPQNSLKGGVGKDWRNFMPVRDNVDAWGSRASSDHLLSGSGNTQIEHDSLRVELVPEPASLIAWSLIGSIFGLGVWRRRQSAN